MATINRFITRKSEPRPTNGGDFLFGDFAREHNEIQRLSLPQKSFEDRMRVIFRQRLDGIASRKMTVPSIIKLQAMYRGSRAREIYAIIRRLKYDGDYHLRNEKFTGTIVRLQALQRGRTTRKWTSVVRRLHTKGRDKEILRRQNRKQRYKKLGQRAVKCAKLLDPKRPYEWWFNLSTKRVAAREAKLSYRKHVKGSGYTPWNDSAEDIVKDEGMPKPASEDHKDLELPVLKTGTDTAPKRFFNRGERAEELAYAAKLHFNKMPFDEANNECVHRWMSRHDLVCQAGVRYKHQSELVDRAKEHYFILLKSDLVKKWTIKNSKNDKRIKQVQGGGW